VKKKITLSRARRNSLTHDITHTHTHIEKKGELDGFASRMRNGPAEKRIWSLVLVFLVLARVQAAYDPENAMVHCAAVHVVEALAFGRELFNYGAKAPKLIFGIIVANAVWFVSAAMRM